MLYGLTVDFLSSLYHFETLGRHLPYGITRCHLPFDTGERVPPELQPADRHSIYILRRNGRLGLGGVRSP